jgi:hypothetical protein
MTVANVINLVCSLLTGWFFGRVVVHLKEIREHRRYFDALTGLARAWPTTAPCYFAWMISDGGPYTWLSKVAYRTAEEAGFAGYIMWRDWIAPEARDRGVGELTIYVQHITLMGEDEHEPWTVAADGQSVAESRGADPTPTAVAASHGTVM